MPCHSLHTHSRTKWHTIELGERRNWQCAHATVCTRICGIECLRSWYGFRLAYALKHTHTHTIHYTHIEKWGRRVPAGRQYNNTLSFSQFECRQSLQPAAFVWKMCKMEGNLCLYMVGLRAVRLYWNRSHGSGVKHPRVSWPLSQRHPIHRSNITKTKTMRHTQSHNKLVEPYIEPTHRKRQNARVWERERQMSNSKNGTIIISSVNFVFFFFCLFYFSLSLCSLPLFRPLTRDRCNTLISLFSTVQCLSVASVWRYLFLNNRWEQKQQPSRTKRIVFTQSYSFVRAPGVCAVGESYGLSETAGRVAIATEQMLKKGGEKHIGAPPVQDRNSTMQTISR